MGSTAEPFLKIYRRTVWQTVLQLQVSGLSIRSTKTMNSEIEFNCPYCGEINFVTVFFSEGKSQNFIQDCEVCCKPIEITISQDNDGNIFLDAKNDEGF